MKADLLAVIGLIQRQAQRHLEEGLRLVEAVEAADLVLAGRNDGCAFFALRDTGLTVVLRCREHTLIGLTVVLRCREHTLTQEGRHVGTDHEATPENVRRFVREAMEEIGG